MAAVQITGPLEWGMFAVTFLTALGTAVAVINRWVVAPMERRRKADDEQRRTETREIVAEATGPINDKLDQVVREVTYNGGSSLKDAVRRIEREQDVLRGRFEEHDRFMHGMRRPDETEPGL